jgi:hypothetical protein
MYMLKLCSYTAYKVHEKFLSVPIQSHYRQTTILKQQVETFGHLLKLRRERFLPFGFAPDT